MDPNSFITNCPVGQFHPWEALVNRNLCFIRSLAMVTHFFTSGLDIKSRQLGKEAGLHNKTYWCRAFKSEKRKEPCIWLTMLRLRANGEQW